jgi:hypothetical protein
MKDPPPTAGEAAGVEVGAENLLKPIALVVDVVYRNEGMRDSRDLSENAIRLILDLEF